MLVPMLATGEYAIPVVGNRLRVTVEGAILAATVSRSDVDFLPGYRRGHIPLVTFAVAPGPAELPVAAKLLGVPPGADVWAPACIVRIEPSIVLAPSDTGWLGDFERCLAWAWIEGLDESRA
jgi:hypothetical protein